MIPNGTYTFTNAAGEHRTFKIKTQAKDAKFAPGKRVAALLTGSDNENDYRGFAFVDENGAIHVWQSKRTPAFQYYANMIAAAASAVQNMIDKETPEASFELQGHKYQVQVSKRCLVCNRALTDPDSIRRQIGPICMGVAA